MGRRKKRKRREVARDRSLGWRLSSQMGFGWPALGCRKGRAPKSPEKASGMTFAVQVQATGALQPVGLFLEG